MFKKLNQKFNSLSTISQIVILLAVVFIVRTWGFGLYQVPTGSMETTMLVGERFFADKLTLHFRTIKRGEIASFLEPLYPYSSNPIKNLKERYVWGPSNWTKRVIGIPGDHVRGALEDGKPVVYLNEVKLDEPYVNKYPITAVWRCPGINNENYEEILRFSKPVGNIFEHRSYDPSAALDKQPFYCLQEKELVKIPLVKSLLYPGTPLDSGKDVFDVHLGPKQYWMMGDNRLGSSDSREWGILDESLIQGTIVFRIWSLDSNESWWIVDLIKHPIDFFKRVRWNRCMQRIS